MKGVGEEEEGLREAGQGEEMLAGYVRGEYKTFLLLPYLSYKDDIYIMNSNSNSNSTAFINIYTHTQTAPDI